MSIDVDDSTAGDIRQWIGRYAPSTGDDRYARFGAEVLDVRRTYPQDQICASLHNYRQTVVSAANGIGKSYIAAVVGLAALYCNPDTIVNVTAGNKGTLKTNIWKPARSMFRNCDALPGRHLDSTREIRTELDDEWFFECVSPRYPDDLEGPHNDHVFYIVEEADKPGVTHEHIDSVRSTATDEGDRILVIANPPKDETNVVYDLMQSDEWNTLEFASWDSHNVRVERGIEDGELIPGLVELSKLEDDWREFHAEPWPGLEQVIEWSDPDSPDFRKDLDERWYRRRAGIMPPAGAAAYRPFYADDVEAALGAAPPAQPGRPEGVGIDLARKGGDKTVFLVKFPTTIDVAAWDHTDHPTNEEKIRRRLEQLAYLPDVAIDATGEGSGVADRMREEFGATRFKANENAVEDDEWDNKWSESLYHLGQAIPSLALDVERDMRQELFTAARTVEFEERGLRSGDVVTATPKEEIKERLGRSPDKLDAFGMACWAANVDPGEERLPLSF